MCVVFSQQKYLYSCDPWIPKVLERCNSSLCGYPRTAKGDRNSPMISPALSSLTTSTMRAADMNQVFSWLAAPDSAGFICTELGHQFRGMRFGQPM